MKMKDVKVGDKLAINSSRGSYHYIIVTVTKVTATQITCDNGNRYSERSRKEIGDSSSFYVPEIAWDYRTGELMTVEKAESINQKIEQEKEKARKARLIDNYPYGKLKLKDMEVLDQIIKLLEIEE